MTISSVLKAAEPSPGPACDLCGFPVGQTAVSESVHGKEHLFCCEGCRHVHRILLTMPDGAPEDLRNTAVFRESEAAGIIPLSTSPVGPDGAPIFSPGMGTFPEPGEERLAGELLLRVDGMWCAACGWLVEKVVGNLPGVLDVKVSFLSDMMRVRYLPHRIAAETIRKKISAIGYTASSFEENGEQAAEKRSLLFRLGISSILTFNVMMISFALYGGFFQDLGRSGVFYLSYPLGILSTPVVFYGGFPLIVKACRGLGTRHTTMELLISVGSLSAFFFSIIQMYRGSLHVYFDTASMLVTLMLIGKYIELRARSRVSDGFRELYRMAGRKVRIVRGAGEKWTSPEKVVTGETFMVLRGESVSLDGRVLSGTTDVDESALTGESKPVKKRPGDFVMAGSVVLDGEVFLSVERSAADSSLGQLVNSIREALNAKHPAELLADSVTRRLIPGVFLLAAGTAFLLWLNGASLEETVLRPLTVLVITCPCALGIAIPLAKTAAVGVGRSRGIVVKNPEALERMKDLDVIVFDKTGTLTEGRYALREIVATETDEHEALYRAACIEAGSDHYLAREIVRSARERGLVCDPPAGGDSVEGEGGIRGFCDSGEVFVGNRPYMEAHLQAVDTQLEEEALCREREAETVVFFAWGGKARGFFRFGDRVKDNAPDTVRVLRQKGYRLLLLSGDSLETTRAVAAATGIDEYVGEALPREKVRIVRGLQENGLKVAMVGDGLNDAGALVQADVGISIGSRMQGVPEAADMAIMGDNVAMAARVLELAALTGRVIRQNLFFAFLYNAIGIPLAVLGLLNPIIAASAMFASSLTVVGNTLYRVKMGANE